jgi:hypothetical protein
MKLIPCIRKSPKHAKEKEALSKKKVGPYTQIKEMPSVIHANIYIYIYIYVLCIYDDGAALT